MSNEEVTTIRNCLNCIGLSNEPAQDSSPEQPSIEWKCSIRKHRFPFQDREHSDFLQSQPYRAKPKKCCKLTHEEVKPPRNNLYKD